MNMPSPAQLDKVWKLFMPVFLGLFAADQLSKAWALERLSPGQGGVELGFSLSYNYGVVFGIRLPEPAIYALSALILGVGVYLVLREKLWRDPWHLVGLALILAGAMGNLVDRVRLGYVVDFIQVYFWPTFNLADAWIVLGVMLFTWIFVVRDNP